MSIIDPKILVPIKDEEIEKDEASENIPEDLADKNFDTLPIEKFRQEILDLVAKNQIIVCIGETGSGKTTQMPQFFLNSTYLANGKMMAVTQPRRIAAISISQRVSEECGCNIGEEVGYSVRFEDQTSSKTKIKFMTDGILIRECLSDHNLSKYGIIMLDEAHERSLNTDILFSLLKSISKLRHDLKIIITSATLDANKFSQYFFSCPILSIPGRTYPVDIYHSKVKQIMTVNGPANQSYIQSAVDIAKRIHLKEGDGHILIFLTGQEEIDKACQLLNQQLLELEDDANHDLSDRELIVLPLYAALTTEDQQKIFMKPNLLWEKYYRKNPSHQRSMHRKMPSIIRKCVLATNIAETSITVPHIRFVIDAGYVKQKVYDPSRGMESLVVVPVSKIAALQRAGRAGRTGPGQCYRLFSSECFDNMIDETVPEVQRTNLANTILYLKALGIHNVLGFDFLDPPSEDQVLQALVQLHTLQALDNKGNITSLGKQLSSLPLDPSTARILFEASTRKCNCLDEIIIICAMLSVENIWVRPKTSKSIPLSSNNNLTFRNDRNNNSTPNHYQSSIEEERCEVAHAAFRHEKGDLLTLWQVFLAWEKSSYSFDWCRRNFINFRSMKMATKIREHLIKDVNKIRLNKNLDDIIDEFPIFSKHSSKPKSYTLSERICFAITAGFFRNSAMKCTADNVYKLLSLPTSSIPSKYEDKNFQLVHINPQSTYSFVESPEYVVYQDLMHQTKLYMRNITWIYHRILKYYQSQYQYVSPRQLGGLEEEPKKDSQLMSNKRPREEIETQASSSKKVHAETIVVKDAEELIQEKDEEELKQLQKQQETQEQKVKQLSAVEEARLRYLSRKGK